MKYKDFYKYLINEASAPKDIKEVSADELKLLVNKGELVQTNFYRGFSDNYSNPDIFKIVPTRRESLDSTNNIYNGCLLEFAKGGPSSIPRTNCIILTNSEDDANNYGDVYKIYCPKEAQASYIENVSDVLCSNNTIGDDILCCSIEAILQFSRHVVDLGKKYNHRELFSVTNPKFIKTKLEKCKLSVINKDSILYQSRYHTYCQKHNIQNLYELFEKVFSDNITIHTKNLIDVKCSSETEIWTNSYLYCKRMEL